MIESKRKFKRFDLPLIVKFRPASGKTPYYLGLLKNISSEGLSLEARDFNFIKYENLELELKFPQGNASVSLSGDVMWKKQDGHVNFAGIRFRVQDKGLRNEILERISYHTNIPIESFIYKQDFYSRGKANKKFYKQVVQKNISREEPQKISLSKQYSEDGAKCNVTFVLPKEAVPEARNVTLAGDFNNWDTDNAQLIKLDSGDFSLTLELDRGREYKFKYFIDGSRWENDWHADRYIPNSMGSDDSVVIT